MREKSPESGFDIPFFSFQSVPMTTAIIGSTGFVGSNLVPHFPDSVQFNSRNIESIRGQHFDRVFCAGIQAKKWWANQHESEDLAAIHILLEALRTVTTDHFTLISTVDVYPIPSGVDESSPVDPAINHAYGRNRFLAEEFVQATFPRHLILRLPGLFGVGLKKNVIHDFIHSHELEKINPRGVYQYYWLGRLPADIQRASELGLSVLNLATEPVGTQEIHDRFFPDRALGTPTEFVASYDMQTLYAADWGSASERYLYDKNAVLEQLAAFLIQP